MCLTDWRNLWFDEAYWHILFSIILLAIMILWRPTNNNQRYAFTPLLDVSDDELDGKDRVEGHRLVEGTEVKSRNQRRSSFSSDNEPDIISKETADNLKWIEENISTTLVDS